MFPDALPPVRFFAATSVAQAVQSCAAAPNPAVSGQKRRGVTKARAVGAATNGKAPIYCLPANLAVDSHQRRHGVEQFDPGCTQGAGLRKPSAALHR
mmetsp:Transcript_6463/g.7562  ORF Transcript_6463/g.7562 Transcript_6463/m.7562 type:complete len:97 (+) Transcript_6463:209-499(+)